MCVVSGKSGNNSRASCQIIGVVCGTRDRFHLIDRRRRVKACIINVLSIQGGILDIMCRVHIHTL